MRPQATPRGAAQARAQHGCQQHRLRRRSRPPWWTGPAPHRPPAARPTVACRPQQADRSTAPRAAPTPHGLQVDVEVERGEAEAAQRVDEGPAGAAPSPSAEAHAPGRKKQSAPRGTWRASSSGSSSERPGQRAPEQVGRVGDGRQRRAARLRARGVPVAQLPLPQPLEHERAQRKEVEREIAEEEALPGERPARDRNGQERHEAASAARGRRASLHRRSADGAARRARARRPPASRRARRWSRRCPPPRTSRGPMRDSREDGDVGADEAAVLDRRTGAALAGKWAWSGWSA